MSHARQWFAQALQEAKEQKSEVPTDYLSELAEKDSDLNFKKFQAQSEASEDFLQVGLQNSNRSANLMSLRTIEIG